MIGALSDNPQLPSSAHPITRHPIIKSGILTILRRRAGLPYQTKRRIILVHATTTESIRIVTRHLISDHLHTDIDTYTDDVPFGESEGGPASMKHLSPGNLVTNVLGHLAQAAIVGTPLLIVLPTSGTVSRVPAFIELCEVDKLLDEVDLRAACCFSLRSLGVNLDDKSRGSTSTTSHSSQKSPKKTKKDVSAPPDLRFRCAYSLEYLSWVTALRDAMAVCKSIQSVSIEGVIQSLADSTRDAVIHTRRPRLDIVAKAIEYDTMERTRDSISARPDVGKVWTRVERRRRASGREGERVMRPRQSESRIRTSLEVARVEEMTGEREVGNGGGPQRSEPTNATNHLRFLTHHPKRVTVPSTSDGTSVKDNLHRRMSWSAGKHNAGAAAAATEMDLEGLADTFAKWGAGGAGGGDRQNDPKASHAQTLAPSPFTLNRQDDPPPPPTLTKPGMAHSATSTTDLPVSVSTTSSPSSTSSSTKPRSNVDSALGGSLRSAVSSIYYNAPTSPVLTPTSFAASRTSPPPALSTVDEHDDADTRSCTSSVEACAGTVFGDGEDRDGCDSEEEEGVGFNDGEAVTRGSTGVGGR
ncbi:hypothetical protein HK104_005563 [Borealophlyctis nickersoniae]|nr:hypothetical protein HK104_005563 [Borealophlyctis nickersoniae]